MDGKRLVFVLSVFSVLLIVAVITLSVLLANKKSSASPDESTKVCTTKACINSANSILKNMDLTADPCEDFNQFTCGNFIKTTRIPDDQSSQDTFATLRVNLAYSVADALEEPVDFKTDSNSTASAKIFYKSCLDEATVEVNGEKWFKDALIDEFGGWPLVGQTYRPLQGANHLQQLIRFRKMGLNPLVYVYVGTNPKDPNLSVLRVGQADWFLNKDYYSNPRIVAAYKEYMTTLVKLLNPSETNANTKVDAVFDLEKRLAQNLYTQAQIRNQTFKNITLKELSQNINSFDWIKYIKDGLFGEFPSVNVNENEIILVNEWDYLVETTKIYSEYIADNSKLEVLDNLLIWSFVRDRTGYLPKDYKNARLDFDKVYSGTNTIPPRSRTCANAISDRMPYAVGRLYVAKNFDENSKRDAEEMIENIRSEFKQILSELTWFDQSSRDKAIEKANYIDPKIGYPDYTYNNTHLDSLYSEYKFEVDRYLQNAISILKADFRKAFSRLRERRNRKDWISGPAVVNAFYSSTLNQICFPAGILQAPFYDALSPNYLNYGGIGSVIGHEITHGFDDKGRLYDKDGVYFEDGEQGLWSNSTTQNYLVKAKCIVDQYSRYLARQVNKTLNGYQTQGENIADNGGVKESFRAYQKWVAKNGPEPLLPGLNFTQNQLFFINYAQVWCGKYKDQALISRIDDGVHSPGEFRIIGPTSNYQEFANAFKCKAGQANNPVDKCAVW